MKVYLIAGLLGVLMRAYGTRGDSGLTLEDRIMDLSLDNSKPMFSDFFKDASQDAKLGKRSDYKEDALNHTVCATLKEHGYCRYSLINSAYCYTTCRCKNILSRDSCKKIKERKECDIFIDHCKLTCGGCGRCSEHALGMQSGAIPDAHITASTTHGGFSPSHGRLNVAKGHTSWAANHNRAGEWLQVDLGKVTKVTGVATQGRHNSNQWVRSYSLKFSLDGKRFFDYEGGKVFQGNRDRLKVVKHELKPAIVARPAFTNDQPDNGLEPKPAFLSIALYWCLPWDCRQKSGGKC